MAADADGPGITRIMAGDMSVDITTGREAQHRAATDMPGIAAVGTVDTVAADIQVAVGMDVEDMGAAGMGVGEEGINLQTVPCVCLLMVANVTYVGCASAHQNVGGVLKHTLHFSF
jgi:hypothetical protein